MLSIYSFVSQSFMNGDWATMQLTCMLPNGCTNTFMSFGEKTLLLLFHSGLPVTLSKSGLYPFLVSFLFGAMMQVIYYDILLLNHILGVFLWLNLCWFSCCRCWLCIFSQSFSSWHMLHRPRLKRYFSLKKTFFMIFIF